MSDYTYDNEDFTAMRVATTDFKNSSCTATWLGLLSGATWLGADYWMSTQKMKSIWGMGPRYAITYSVLAGSLAYMFAYSVTLFIHGDQGNDWMWQLSTST